MDVWVYKAGLIQHKARKTWYSIEDVLSCWKNNDVKREVYDLGVKHQKLSYKFPNKEKSGGEPETIIFNQQPVCSF